MWCRWPIGSTPVTVNATWIKVVCLAVTSCTEKNWGCTNAPGFTTKYIVTSPKTLQNTSRPLVICPSTPFFVFWWHQIVLLGAPWHHLFFFSTKPCRGHLCKLEEAQVGWNQKRPYHPHKPIDVERTSPIESARWIPNVRWGHQFNVRTINSHRRLGKRCWK